MAVSAGEPTGQLITRLIVSRDPLRPGSAECLPGNKTWRKISIEYVSKKSGEIRREKRKRKYSENKCEW